MTHDVVTVAPVGVAEIAELLLERLGATEGNWRIELLATDGRLRRWRREQEGGRDDLSRSEVRK